MILIFVGVMAVAAFVLMAQISGNSSGDVPPSISAPASTPAPASTTPTGVEPDAIDPHDESTWPSNDLTDNVVHAIAIAEGYGASARGLRDSAGTSRHNPGDLSDNSDAVTQGVTYEQSYHSGSNIVDYVTHTNGWNICRNKVNRIVNGQSSIASARTTWVGLVNVWVGDVTRRAGWVQSVSNQLGVDINDNIGDYFGV